MAALLSSPPAPQYRHDPFEQPSSPKCYSLHDDLPADFDKSFGSSMSISDSLDGHSSQPLAAAAAAAAMPPPPFLFGNSLGLPTAFHAKSHQPQFLAQLHHQPTSHISPRPANSLGAAMGTSLNARSPNLAAKMSSPKDMDISPAPVAPLAHVGPSPSEALPHLLDNIHVGRPSTAAAANLHHDRLHPVLGGSTRPRPLAAERKSSLQLAHSMSSRLFGAEIALNSNRIFARDHQLLSSPDKEPPPKRRPNSLPTRQSEANERISQLSAALTAIAPPRTRPALSATFDGAFGVASSSQPTSSFALRSCSPDAVASLNKRNSKRSSRASSAESFFEDVENELGAQSTAGETQTTDAHWQHRALLDHDHDDAADEDDANPSPSPSMTSIAGNMAGTMAGYFFDPMSPEKLGSRLGMPPVDGPNLLAAMSSTANSPSVSSPPASSPCTRMPPPKRTTSLGTRAFARAKTMAVVPRVASASSSASGSGYGSASTSTAAAGAASRTMLGKRANPYVKRPSLTNATATVKSAYPVLGVAGQTNRVVRPTAPAPRRCFSAFDHRSALAAGAPPSKLAAPAIDSPASPDRRRTQLSSHAEMSDANGSPIAPAMRARTRPNFLRRGSKDDSSPLAYGTGIKRSGSRGNDMVDDLALADPAYTSSPASAESLPGFGASEKEGKVLPCFNVKEDGLMRITPQTMTDLLAGKYTNAIQSFQVVDCRFGYEYEGGHIPGAINLSTVDRVVGHFLTPGQGRHAGGIQLPPRSQSGRADSYGNRRKHVIVFHCEFSCKRAPSMALALRQADRGLAHDYPNCHFPEIYILQGGYCGFFREYAQLCEPQQYICMDDPRFVARRSSELNGFRKQFSRHRSFTYGEGRRQISQSYQGRQTIKEEDASLMDESPCSGVAKMMPREASSSSVVVREANEQAGDASFGSVGDSSFEDGIGDSPCAAAGSRKPVTMLLQPRVGSLGRRPLLRAGTTGNILPRF